MGTWYAHESDESMTPVAQPLKTQYIDETRMFFRQVVLRLRRRCRRIFR